MPRRDDISTILVLGAGPIVIGQACEFDYSGTQAVKALSDLGYQVVLVNSNPATIMTDPSLCYRTYIEPIHWQVVAKIIESEKPDAILPTMGGQTALNCALDLAKQGILEAHGVEMIGASVEAIDMAEDREKFREVVRGLGLDMPHSVIAHSLEQAFQEQAQVGYPAIIRPSFTMGGSGGGIAYNREEFESICAQGLELSPTNELLIDESLLGWKEFELEVVRDAKDNAIVVCGIENFDPMGVHTGDSITVAPPQTLTDKEYQRMRDAAIAILRRVGVDTGGANVQFGLNPVNGRMVVIEMNPRVSRSSALASKATGFPIAKVAAKLAVGFSLDELRNDITGDAIPASFEPTLDYVVTKIPRFNFDKFPQTSPVLTTQMKSVGEVMAVGRSFIESMQKACRSLEIGRPGLVSQLDEPVTPQSVETVLLQLSQPTPDRLWHIADAFRLGIALEKIAEVTGVDPWFLAEIVAMVSTEQQISQQAFDDCSAQALHQYKAMGFSDQHLASLWAVSSQAVMQRRLSLGVKPVYKRIDSCAAEFPTETAYFYSTYEMDCESTPSAHNNKVMIIGGGPNRIGQGIEFDYCCVHAVQAFSEAGLETIMVNCNPETVSTDYDVSHRLYFEAITFEDVMAIIELEKPMGVVVHYGGQTPLKLAKSLSDAGVPLLGTTAEAIDIAEDREKFKQLAFEVQLNQPANGIVRSVEEAITLANNVGYPLIVRPSYVLGGRAMEIVYDQQALSHYLNSVVTVTDDSPVLIDSFLDDAIEVDIDAVFDGEQILIGGIMEHIEQAGIHSGDSACTLPPMTLSMVMQRELIEQLTRVAKRLGVVGLLNAQFAIQSDDVYILEVNPRASRTVPFVSKATGVSLAKVAARCKIGQSLKAQGFVGECLPVPSFYSVKLPVFPFVKFSGVDSVLGPEMRSTGEAMGIAKRFGQAYAKAMLGANEPIERRRRAFVSVRDADKARVGDVAKGLAKLGFEIYATEGTARLLKAAGIVCIKVNKVAEGRPHIVDHIKNNEIDFIVNTTEGQVAIRDSYQIRRSALSHKVRYTTTLSGAEAACMAMRYEDRGSVYCLQDIVS